jgi:hypothetical protein
MVLGGGPNRIGQGIELTAACMPRWRCTQQLDVMVNCSGDRFDRLRHLRSPVFRAADAEDVLEIVHRKAWA